MTTAKPNESLELVLNVDSCPQQTIAFICFTSKIKLNCSLIGLFGC